MKRKYFGLFATVAILFVTSPAKSATIATMQLTSAGTNIVGGVYVDPYFATINGVANQLVICDDFVDDTYLNESWTADVTQVSNLTSTSPVKWTTGAAANPSVAGLAGGLDETHAYIVAAILATEILQAYNAHDTTAAGEYTFALWGLFDSSAFSYNAGATFNMNNAKTDLSNAITAANGKALSDYAGVTIYTPDQNYAITCPGGNGSCNTTPPQEFLTVRTPEASAPVLLALDLSVLVGLTMLLRRRAIASCK